MSSCLQADWSLIEQYSWGQSSQDLLQESNPIALPLLLKIETKKYKSKKTAKFVHEIGYWYLTFELNVFILGFRAFYISFGLRGRYIAKHLKTLKLNQKAVRKALRQAVIKMGNMKKWYRSVSFLHLLKIARYIEKKEKQLLIVKSKTVDRKTKL